MTRTEPTTGKTRSDKNIIGHGRLSPWAHAHFKQRSIHLDNLTWMQLPLAVNILHKVARPRNCKTWRHSNWETWLYSEQDCILVIWNSLQRSLNMAKNLWRIWSTSSWPAGKPLRQLWHARPRRGGSKIKTWTGKNASEDLILPVNSQPFHIHLCSWSLLIRIKVSYVDL